MFYVCVLSLHTKVYSKALCVYVRFIYLYCFCMLWWLTAEAKKKGNLFVMLIAVFNQIIFLIKHILLYMLTKCSKIVCQIIVIGMAKKWKQKNRKINVNSITKISYWLLSIAFLSVESVLFANKKFFFILYKYFFNFTMLLTHIKNRKTTTKTYYNNNI